MNAHFGLCGDGQTKSAKLLYEYSKRISDYPTFVIGDFNMKPNNPGYRMMLQRFIDANLVTVNYMRQTYHGYNPEKHREKHIDNCFADEKIILVKQEIIDNLADGKYPSVYYDLYIILYMNR